MSNEQTIDPEDVIHYAETDTSGEPGDCIDDCFGCVVERVARYVNEREDVQALGDVIHELNGGEDVGGQSLWLSDVERLVRAAIEAEGEA